MNAVVRTSTLSADDLDRALAMWRHGNDTYGIAKVLGLPEAVVANALAFNREITRLARAA